MKVSGKSIGRKNRKPEIGGEVVFRFYAGLNDFLPLWKQNQSFKQPFSFHETVKHIIESQGIPHTEVHLILINGKTAGFSSFLTEGDRVSVYPWFSFLDVSPISLVEPQPLDDTRFVLDNHLGKLANYLRLLGFDTLYRNDFNDRELARISREEKRILLTRDRGLLKRKIVRYGCCIRETEPEKQLLQVIRRFDLCNKTDPYRRCARCNGVLAPVSKAQVIDDLEPLTRQYFDDFRQCRNCGQIYWEGSHFGHMDNFFQDIMRKAQYGQEANEQED